MKLRGPGGMPQDLYLASGGHSSPGGQWPRGWRELARALERPWAALALLGLCLGAALRYPLLPLEAGLSLTRLLDSLHLMLWFSAAWLTPALERLLWRQTRSGLGGGPALTGMLFGNGLLLLLASGLLSLAPSAALLAFNPAAELMSYHDAEHHFYFISLGGAYFGTMLLGGSVLIALSNALHLLLRRFLGSAAALGAWLLCSLLLNFGLLCGNGWLSTLGLRTGSAWTNWLQPGLGGLLHQRLRDFLLAEERYQYGRELIAILLRDSVILLLLALLMLVLAQLAWLSRRRAGLLLDGRPAAWALDAALWSSVLFSFAMSFGHAVWFAANPAASGPAAPGLITQAGMLAALGTLWLLACLDPQALLARQRPALWGRLACLPLLWLGLCSPAISAGLADRQAALLACASAAALLAAGLCLLLLVSALQSFGRDAAGVPGRLALLLCGALLLLPLAGWQSGLAAAQAWCLELLQSAQTAPATLAALALLALASTGAIWLIQRPLLHSAKAAAAAADTNSSAR